MTRVIEFGVQVVPATAWAVAADHGVCTAASDAATASLAMLTALPAGLTSEEAVALLAHTIGVLVYHTRFCRGSHAESLDLGVLLAVLQQLRAVLEVGGHRAVTLAATAVHAHTKVRKALVRQTCLSYQRFAARTCR